MHLIRVALLFAGLAFAAVVLLSAFGSTSGPNRQDAVFHAITSRNIRDIQTRINGSADARNQIPTGTILTYRTNAGNLGKLQILKYGYNLRVRWVTYLSDGAVLSSGKKLIRGTYGYDLDRGVETSKLGPPTDLWWEQATKQLRYAVAMNGASFTIASYNPCELTGRGVSPCG